jgi:Ser/Thr protein kinase RdoA (MazF antagonist)
MQYDATTNDPIRDFDALTLEMAIALVEQQLGVSCTNLCRPLNSYINRVFEIGLMDGGAVVAKFYRPGRWSLAALRDEHEFLAELADRDIPVIAPMRSPDGQSIGEHRGMFFTVFPKKLGRAIDEPTYDQWEELGRLLARVHLVGEMHLPEARIIMGPQESTRQHIEFILGRGVVPQNLRDEFERAAYDTIEMITPLFAGVERIRIHGDCHYGNIVYRPGESFYLIDFDDMVVGPPVQDLWMLLPGYAAESRAEIEMMLEGYETFRRFDRRTLRLIEPLRAMRFLHFLAWCAVQAADGSASRLAPGWGTPSYWQTEISDLRRQQDEIAASRDMQIL